MEKTSWIGKLENSITIIHIKTSLMSNITKISQTSKPTPKTRHPKSFANNWKKTDDLTHTLQNNNKLKL